MAYNLRKRKENVLYNHFDSDSESDKCSDLRQGYAGAGPSQRIRSGPRGTARPCGKRARTAVSGDLGARYNRVQSEDASDDACIVCADGGDLICCSECTLTYHMDCLHMKDLPDEYWVCPCCLCAHCGLAGTKNKNITECNLCSKTYHLACHGNPRLGVSPLCSKFCGDACAKIEGEVKKILGMKNDLGEGFSWILIHHNDKDTDYRVRKECNSKIALAWDLLNRAFEPVIDRLTEVNILKNVIYNISSTSPRIDFKGFYTAVLQKGEVVVAAATIRMRGAQMAEMPFVATDERHRNQRMLSRLMAAIGTTLSEIGIEYLVIPSAEDVQEMWINKFGFELLSSSLEHGIMISKTLMFPNSVRLQKNLTSRAVETEPDRKVPLPFDLNLTTHSAEAEPEQQLEGPDRKAPLPFDLNLDPEDDPYILCM